jgi:hypothetical protein
VQRALSGTHSFIDNDPSHTTTPPPVSHRPIRLREKISVVEDNEHKSIYSHFIGNKAKVFAHKMSVDRKRREVRLKTRFDIISE